MTLLQHRHRHHHARLPRLLVLTDRRQCGAPLVEVIAAAVRGGARAVVLREKDLGYDDRAHIAAQLGAVLAAVNGLLLAASDTGTVVPTASGVHLSAPAPVPREPRPSIVGRSCHDDREVRRAAEEGCNYATLSPIFASASKRGYGPAVGLAALRDAPLPLYALGGVDATNAGACIDAGAAGVAVVGAVMGASDPEAAVRDLIAAVGGQLA